MSANQPHIRDRGLRAFALCSLAFFMLCTAPLVAQTSETYKPHVLERSLRDRASSAIQKKDYAVARDLYERWLQADPRDNSSWYNLACVYALTGEKDLALDAFERSVDAGWKDAVHPTRDTDLDSIRSDARFDAALQRISQRIAANGPSGFVRHFAEMKSRGSYIVMLPPDYETSSKEYPICVILHGSGSSDVAHGRVSDSIGREGVIYIAPRAPFPHAGVAATGVLGWTASPPDEIPESDPSRVQVVPDYVDWIFTCVDEVQKSYRAHKGKVHLYGHSQGGNVANVAALLHPERVATYYSQAASLPDKRFLTLERATRMKESGVRAHLIHGEQDNVVSISTTKTIDQVLSESGVEHTVRYVQGDHGFNPVIYGDIRAWIENEVRDRQ